MRSRKRVNAVNVQAIKSRLSSSVDKPAESGGNRAWVGKRMKEQKETKRVKKLEREDGSCARKMKTTISAIYRVQKADRAIIRHDQSERKEKCSKEGEFRKHARDKLVDLCRTRRSLTKGGCGASVKRCLSKSDFLLKMRQKKRKKYGCQHWVGLGAAAAIGAAN